MRKKNQTSKLDISQETVPTFKTDRELVEYLFITEILKAKYPQKITSKTTLLDFIPKEHRSNPEFVDGYLQMYEDMAVIKFRQVLLKKYKGKVLESEKDRSIKELIDFLAKKRAWNRK